MNTEVFIELDHLSKSFRDIQAVDKLSLKVFKGDVYGFLGPNGAGKSTTIRMMLSLITPTSGNISLFGQNLSQNRKQILQRIGALIEKPDFYNWLSAFKNLEILGKLSNVHNLPDKIMEVLEIVGLEERAHSRVKTYSQGMRQRLGIAQALLHNPELMILDEPSNGLDPQGQKEMRTLIRSLNTQKGITIVISSHILAEIEQIASRMVIIDKGKAIVEGDVEQLLNASDMNVKIEVDNPAMAVRAIENTKWKSKLTETSNGKLNFKMDRSEIPSLTSYFYKNGLKIFSINPKRSLEDYFISITEHE